MEPVTRAVLERIAIEERSHAELSWAIVSFCLERGGDVVAKAVRRARRELVAYERPTAVAGDKIALVRRADPVCMRAHGRPPDEAWAEIYAARLDATITRLDALSETRSRSASGRADEELTMVRVGEPL